MTRSSVTELLEAYCGPIVSEVVRGRAVKPCPPDRLPREGESIFSRITTRSVSDYIIDPDTGCWLWQKFLLRGYAQSGTIKVHRLYYERAHGSIPPNHDVHHLCKRRACVNPEHLEAIHWREHDKLHWLNEKGLTLEDVRHVRELGRQPGASAPAIAEEYGVTRWTIHNWWRDYTWSDLLAEDGPVEGWREGGRRRRG